MQCSNMQCSEFHQLLIHYFFHYCPYSFVRNPQNHSNCERPTPFLEPLSLFNLPSLSTASPPSLSTFRTNHRSPLSTHTLLSPRSQLSRQTAAPLSLLERAGSGRLRGSADEVKALILGSVNAWKNYKMRIPFRSSALRCNPTEQELTGQKYCALSTLGT